MWMGVALHSRGEVRQLVGVWDMHVCACYVFLGGVAQWGRGAVFCIHLEFLEDRIT